MKGLADAALSRGHEVTLFFSDVSVRLLLRGGDGGFSELGSSGSRLLACRTSVVTSGIPSEGGLVEGVEMSSLGELVGIIEEHDRVLFMGGDDR